MDAKEAIIRIEDHNRVHAVKEYPFAIKITEALDIAVKALEKQIPKKPIKLVSELLIREGWTYKCPTCLSTCGENKYHPEVTQDGFLLYAVWASVRLGIRGSYGEKDGLLPDVWQRNIYYN